MFLGRAKRFSHSPDTSVSNLTRNHIITTVYRYLIIIKAFYVQYRQIFLRNQV